MVKNPQFSHPPAAAAWLGPLGVRAKQTAPARRSGDKGASGGLESSLELPRAGEMAGE
jgi:hypothetical protein